MAHCDVVGMCAVNVRGEAMSRSGRTPSLAVLQEFVNKVIDEFEHPSANSSRPGADLMRSSSGRRLEKQGLSTQFVALRIFHPSQQRAH
jgi:hypothetical protein